MSHHLYPLLKLSILTTAALFIGGCVTATVRRFENAPLESSVQKL